MGYLLDTHVFIWLFQGADKLGATARTVISDEDAKVYVSIASLWEFAIKHSVGKLKFDGGLTRLMEIVSHHNFVILPIEQRYLEGIIGLPFIHRDPFDRILIAVAKADGLTILTADENIRKYDVPTVW